MKIRHNLVGIVPDKNHETQKGYALGTFVNEARHYSIRGRVVAVPEVLCYNGHAVQSMKKRSYGGSYWARKISLISERSLEYDADMELQVGDEAIFHYINHNIANDEGMWLNWNGEKVYLLKYDLLYARIRDSVLHPLNGWIMVDPIEVSPVTEKGFANTGQSQYVKGRGIVRHVGNKIGGYLYYPGHVDSLDISVGDTVYFSNACSTSFEWKGHAMNEHPMYRMHRKDILALE